MKYAFFASAVLAMALQIAALSGAAAQANISCPVWCNKYMPGATSCSSSCGDGSRMVADRPNWRSEQWKQMSSQPATPVQGKAQK